MIRMFQRVIIIRRGLRQVNLFFVRRIFGISSKVNHPGKESVASFLCMNKRLVLVIDCRKIMREEI